MMRELKLPNCVRWSAVCAGLIFCAAAVAMAAGNSATSSPKTALPSFAAQAAGPSGYHLIKSIPVSGDTFWDYLNTSLRRTAFSSLMEITSLWSTWKLES